MISVIIPALNEEKFLPHLLASLANQTTKNFEVIVVDGNSKDKTAAIARSFSSKLPKLTVVTKEKPSLPGQRNLGATIAKGNWFVFVDADSIFMPYAIGRMSAFIKEKNPILFTSWFCPDSEVDGDAMATLFLNMVFEGALLLHRPAAPGPLAVVSRSAFTRVGGYDEALEWGEDFDFTKRVCATGTKLAILRETIYIYSLRRFRHQGTLKSIQSYARAIFSILITNNAPRYIPGYIMGGHPYTKQRKPIKQSVIRQFNKKFREIIRELFT